MLATAIELRLSEKRGSLHPVPFVEAKVISQQGSEAKERDGGASDNGTLAS